MGKTVIWYEGTIDIATLNEREQGSLSSHLGIEVAAAGPDWVSARMPVDDRTRQIHGRLHGGASVALCETVGSLAANLTLDQAESIAVGLEINANHVRPVRSGLVEATALAESLGRTTQIWGIRVEDQNGKLVCLSRLTMAVIPLERK